MAEPGAAGIDNNANDAAGTDGGAKGSPDPKAENARLKSELERARSHIADLEKQQTTLQESLNEAMSEEDVKSAVEKAKSEAEELYAAAQQKWDAEKKRLSVENALVTAGCTDVVGCVAHLDLDKIEVAADGHIAGLDTKALAKEHPHLFAAGQNTSTVSSAAPAGGPAHTITKEEIMKERDGAKRRALIADHMDLFE